MSKFVKTLSLILALLMLVSTLAACGGSGDEGGNETKKPGESVAGTAGGEAATDKVLPALNWNGTEYRVLGRDYTSDIFKNFEIDRDELPEDVVGAAVWTRNQNIMDKYGLDVVGTLEKDPTATAKLFLEAGDDNYDLFMCSPEDMHPFAMQGYLINLYDLEYINMDHDAWNDYANGQLTMGGKLYYTTNKFLLQEKHRTWAYYYNRELARELNVGYLEDEVFDGKWTLDRVIEIAKATSSEYDGEDGITYYDRWGVSLSDKYCFAQMLFGAGFRLTERGSDGYPKLAGASDETLSIIDKVYELTLNQDICFTTSIRSSASEVNLKGANIFTEGRAVLMGHCISKIDELTEKSAFEFGFLPNPKLNEKQEEYSSFPNYGNGSLFAVPASVVDLAKAGFGLEAISEESVDTTYYAYIETKCKLQDAFDEDAAKCLDIIFEGVVYDIAFTSNIGGLGSLVKDTLVAQKTNTYARLYDRISKIAEKEIAKIKETYSAQ